MIIKRGESLSPALQGVLIGLAVALLAGTLRLVGLATLTPGFHTSEATTALMARRVHRDNLPIFFGHDQDALAPFLPYMVKVTGSLTGWDATGPRLAAALCGIAAAVFCALWLVRAIGPVWGLASGVLAATSFWQIMFSRQAVPPISSAMFAALGLWLIWIALEYGSRNQPARFYRRTDLPWYVAAGTALGLGFLTHASYVVVPTLILLAASVLAGNQLRARRDADVLGPALLLLAMLVAMTPLASHFLDQPEDIRRALDLTAGLPEDLTNTGGDVASGLLGLVWHGSEDAAVNLPGRPIFDPIIALWMVAGLLAALRHPTRALEGTLLIWTVVGVFAISLIGDNDPSLYFPLTPVFIALPVLGMQAAWRIARDRLQAARSAAIALITLSIVISAGWSIYDYFWQWSDAPETYEAMRGDVRDALDSFGGMPDDDIPAYIIAGDAGRIVRYLAPERPLHQIEGRNQISIPFNDDTFLIAPRSTGPAPQLRNYLADADLVETGEGPGGELSYRIWLIGPRTRDGLPSAVPSIPFNNGWLLTGFDARAGLTVAGRQPNIEVVLLWQVPRDADPFEAEVRLRPPGDAGIEFITESRVLVVPWKAPGISGVEYLLVYTELPFPQTGDQIASLQIGLRDPATGQLSEPLLNKQDDGYAFLNDLQIILP
ncbi:hypothetical protein BH23CHL2_BH23CHL2_27590 [soil metagenome]